jgi:hypothetical protein
MDTYPYGADASPVVRMKNGKSPTIDSLGDFVLFGKCADAPCQWDNNGKSNFKTEFDLHFDKLFYERIPNEKTNHTFDTIRIFDGMRGVKEN